MLGLPRIGGAAFSPKNSALRLWLAADMGASVTAGNLTGLADQGPSGNDATAIGTLPYTATGIGGRPTWLNAATTGLSGAVTPVTYAGTLNRRSIFIVASPTAQYGGPVFQNRLGTGPDGVYFAGHSYTPAPLLIFTDNSDGAKNAFNSSPPSVAPHVYEFWHANGGLLSMAVDGVSLSITQGLAANAEAGTAGYLVGQWSLASAGFEGYISEVLVYNSDQTPAIRSQIRGYLGTKYGISVV